MTTLSVDNRLVYKTLRCITTKLEFSNQCLSPADSTLFVTGDVVVEGTVGLASTHAFRSSRVGAVTARKLIQYLKTTLYC